MSAGVVYLLHFERPIMNARARYTAAVQHYLGFTTDLTARLAEHRAGTGARLPAVFAERGIGFECVRTWVGGRQLEKHLKRQKHAWRHCPTCRAGRAAWIADAPDYAHPLTDSEARRAS